MSRPLFMKTYGKKQTRKLNAWISPDYRKHAFASTSSSDLSIGRPTSPKPPVRRVRKSTAAGRGLVRSAKTKALACLGDSDSDGENVFIHPLPQSQQQRTNTASAGRKHAVSTSESDGEASLRQQNIKRPRITRTKTHTDPTPGEAPGRFVTHRRAANKHKAPKRRNNVLLTWPSPNSSNDFVQGGGGGVRRAFPRRATREPRRAVVSSGSPLADLENCSTGSGFLREVSLNELSERSLGPCRRKPLFSSTPSSRSFTRPPRLHPSISPTSHLLVLSSSQEEMEVPDEPLPVPITDPHPGPGQLSSRGQLPGQPGLGNCKEPPSHASPSLGSSESQNGGSEIQHGVVNQLSRALISVVACEQNGTDRDGEETEGGSHFVSATVGRDWLAEVKEKCLAPGCVVRLERVDKLHQDTTYSSCIDLTPCPDSAHSHDHRESADLATQTDQPSVQIISDDDEPFECNTRQVNGGQCKYQTQSVNGGQYIRRDRSSIRMISVNSENTRLTDEGQSLDSTLSRCQNSKEAFSLEAKFKQKCLEVDCQVLLERLTTTHPPTETLHSSSLLSHTRSDSGTSGKTDRSYNHKTHSDSVQSEDRTRPANVARKKKVPKKWKAGMVPKERKRRSMSKDRGGVRPRTSRKACVSGMSVGRWGGRDRVSKAAPPHGQAGDSSITELLSAQHTHKVLGDNVMLGTPVRRSRLPLSSLLVNLSPDTHSWSRLKAALSVHRKTKAFLTPKGLPRYLLSSPMGIRAELADVSQDLFATPLRTPLPQHLRSQLMRSTPLSVCELNQDLSDAEKVYSECGQAGPVSFQDCIPSDRMKNISKIGEGTFGEVFSTNNTAGELVALKIIPVEGSEQVNGEEQKTFGEILHEIIISKELSSLKAKTHNQTTGFIGLKDLHCVQGRYPPDLLKAWDCFNTLRGSENDRPDFFSEDQLFLILEFEFGGSDLENSNGKLASVGVAKSILHQVAAALAVAEQELHFEHRDLHWGNVLVQTTKDKQGSFMLNGMSHSIETRGVSVRIIDYSLSRLEIDGLTVSCDISEDEELFQGQGDYQFDIYRIMRQENRNVWSEFHPHSNVLWLHYLCSKLLTMAYRSRGGRGIKQTRMDLQHFHDNVLTCSSASEVLHNCSHLLL
uniref:Serine/threonine-protein kinase haspin n=1 Tax=Esox lucius TaxID=8010 RepID=A0AAY5K8T0_ESOLU